MSESKKGGMLIRYAASAQAAGTWWCGETPFVQMWKAATAAVGELATRFRPGRRRIRVSGLSAEWLRCYEIESLKHLADH